MSVPCDSTPEAVQAVAVTLGTASCKLGTALYNFTEFFSCRNWNGLYAQVMYSTVCYNGTTAFDWIATCEFLVVVFSMIFLTLRAGLLDDEVKMAGKEQDGADSDAEEKSNASLVRKHV